MLIKKGDIVRVLFPNSDLKTAKRRPVLIIQADGLNTGMRQHVVAMITSNMYRANHLSRVTILMDSTEGKSTGIRIDSIIMTDNLATISESEIDSILGTLPNMSEVESALKHTFGIK
jgi:mRNA interferase MazF